MKVVILAGGYGTRLSEYTQNIPKPMIRVGRMPLIWHVMQTFARYGFKEFVIALGYKGEVLKEFFINYSALRSDFTVSLADGSLEFHKRSVEDLKVTLVDTGQETMTGGRIKHLQDEPFFATYGDGVGNIDLDELLVFHKETGAVATVTAVRPPARFGELEFDGNKVSKFCEKPQLGGGWISGGYFIFQPDIFDHIESASTMLEREPLERLSKAGQLMAYRHHGFWQCIDTKRDLDLMTSLCGEQPPWLT